MNSNMPNKFLMWFFRVILKKSYVTSGPVVYERWSPEENSVYFYPADLDEGNFEVRSSTFSIYMSEEYKKGRCLLRFRTKSDAKEASKRLTDVLIKYHEELGY